DGKLGPADMSGACFTISSLGGIGGTYFAPIVNAPEVAILGVNKSVMKPVWDGKAFVPRLTLPMSLTADHRVIDGALAKKARDGKLGPADMSGACFTISSLGGIGGTYFAPIVNAPEVAILGVNKSVMKPVWDGKAFVPRLTLPMSLTADHRVIDGALATRFNVYLAQLLADFRRVML
ncbi:MAG: 2-oxo acid dehydrogenase subunit E2, partial [Proteobacteria bacterium]|nr:2-oxo acid dehydrogenase subunit E2 [Pseudomonadota bacterium]